MTRKTPPLPEPTVCARCGAIFLRKTWRHEHTLSEAQIERSRWGFCPACEQVARLEGQGRLIIRRVEDERLGAELVASIAHELNQPLAAILTNAETLQAILASDEPDIEEVKAGIADIIQDNNRARQIIQRVWALFRRDIVTKSKLDVAELVSEIARLVRSDALIRNIAIAVEVKHPIPPIFADRIQIQQAIMNLVSNAFDAVAGIDDGPRDVRIEARARDEGGSVQILVRDSGRGIEPEALPKIFEVFFTTKPKGIGMGLAITKSIIEAHGGRLLVLSNSERGTTFEIMLPSAERPGRN